MAGKQSFEVHAEINRTVHGVDEDTCAICGGPRASDGFKLDREHAHFGGYYPRGLAHWTCNKILGQVERGRDGEAWLESALEFCRRSREHHEREAAA